MSKFNLPSIKQQKLYDNLTNYSNQFIEDNKPFKNKIDNDILINLFKENLNNLPFQYKMNLFKSISSDNLINSVLLSYELKNLTKPKRYDKKTLIKFIEYTFLRYTNTTCNDSFKFLNWKKWNLDTTKRNKPFIYYNLIHDDNLYELNNKQFIIDLFNFFNRNIINYSVFTEKYYIERDKLNYIFFIFVKS